MLLIGESVVMDRSPGPRLDHGIMVGASTKMGFFGFWGLLYHVISHSHRLLGTWPSLLFAECWGVAPSPPFSETPIFDADIRVIPSGKPIKLPGF